MKKLLFVMGILLFVGGGCVSAKTLGGVQRTVEGDWYLAFDLPNGWVMTDVYDAPRDEAVTPNQTVTREQEEIYLQTTTKAILLGGIGAEDTVAADTYVALQDQTLIKVSRLDSHRVVPSEAEDLGDGFFRVKECEDGEDCQIYGRYNYDYYLKTDGANYEFEIYGSDTKQAENIILSAEVVTDTVVQE